MEGGVEGGREGRRGIIPFNYECIKWSLFIS